MREVPYLRDLALIVALGAAAETLLDYLLNARAAEAFPPGQPLMSFFALFHTGVGLLALASQLALSRPALRRMGLAGTVALRPAAVAVAALAGALDPRLLDRPRGPGRSRRAAQLAVPLRLRAALHAAPGAAQAADKDDRGRRVRQAGRAGRGVHRPGRGPRVRLPERSRDVRGRRRERSRRAHRVTAAAPRLRGRPRGQPALRRGAPGDRGRSRRHDLHDAGADGHPSRRGASRRRGGARPMPATSPRRWPICIRGMRRGRGGP